MKTKTFSVTISLLGALILWLPSLTQAQVTPDVLEGLGPYQSFHGGDIDSINLSNGNLLLRIPLYSYPQRGSKLRANAFFVENSKIASTGRVCYGSAGCDYVWDGGGDTRSSAPVVFNEIVGDQGLSSVVTDFFEEDGSEIAFYAIVSPEGAMHPLDANPSLTGFVTTDSTGLYANPSPPNWLTAPTMYIDRDGVRNYVNSSIALEDPNGNEITSTGDSMGRPAATYTSTTDYSGCAGTRQITSAGIMSVPGPNGGTMNFKLCTITLESNIPAQGPIQAYSGTEQYLIQSIVLPNGTAWVFDYNDRNPGDPQTVNYGIPTQITLPTGGTITYTYSTIKFLLGGGGGNPSWSRWVATRTVNANDGTGPHEWTYSYSGVGYSPATTTVTDPLGNQTIHTFTGGNTGYFETETQIYQLVGGIQVLQKTVQTAYKTLNYGSPWYPMAGVVPQSVTTTWPNGQVSQVQTDYDTETNGALQWSYGDVIAKREYDYGNGAPGSLLRTTTMTYESPGNSNYLANNLFDLVTSVKVTDGGGTQRAYTTYGYDETTPVPSGITTQHDSNPPDGIYRGNQTSINKWLNATGSNLTTTSTYFDTGEVNVVTDPNKNRTTYGYSGTYVGAYPTSITNALNQTTAKGYDFNMGLVTSITDPNQLETTFGYDSETARKIQANFPNDGQITYCYSDTPSEGCSSQPPYKVIVTKTIATSPTEEKLIETGIVDGLGRVSETELNSDPQGVDYVVTTYDADGRKASVTNPYRTQTDSTYGVTNYQYDALNRVKQVTQPDGSGSTISTVYCGGSTLVTDESGRWRRSTSDGLGRLTEVDEPNSLTAQVNSNGCPSTGDPIWKTTYTYDALNDLTGVTQNSSRTRNFVYDSLKRLTSATNPESGAVSYTYDSDGNMLTKTDARNAVGTYTYDALNRIKSKSFATDGNLGATYTYDTTECFTVPRCANIGHLTQIHDEHGDELMSFDTQDNETSDTRNILGKVKITTYYYNLDSSLKTIVYPSLRQVNYTTDTAGRPSVAQDNSTGTFYAQGSCSNGVAGNGVCYSPTGAVAQMINGANLTTTLIYNNRLQPCWIYSTTGTALATSTLCSTTDSSPGSILDLKYSLNWGAGDNGDVIGITNNRDNTRSQAFTYDQVNRLLTGETTSTYSTSPSHCWGESYEFDNQTNGTGAWGNLTNINVASSSYNGCSQESLSVTATSNNRLSATGYSYDAAGNMLSDGHNSYEWYSEGSLEQAAGQYYMYDGRGNRTEKAGLKFYWYGLGSQVLDESDTTGNITDEYVYLGSQRVAHILASGGSVDFYGQDHLGTSRVMVAAGATSPCYDADFYPFGGERAYTTTCTQNYKFTGKERDSESGLDNFGARYDSSATGRFISADSMLLMRQKMTDPQQWNMYPYVRNNPLKMVDTNGKWPTSVHEQIINRAFPGLSNQQLQTLKDASYWMDHGATSQMKSHNHEHFMKSPGENPQKAAQAARDYISGQEHAAQQAQGGTPENTSQINSKSLTDVGNAIHTATDGTSPAHVDANGDPRDWNGIPVTPEEVKAAQQHEAEEANPTDAQLNGAVDAARQVFKDTYGDASYQQAITPPPPIKKDPQ